MVSLPCLIVIHTVTASTIVMLLILEISIIAINGFGKFSTANRQAHGLHIGELA